MDSITNRFEIDVKPFYYQQISSNEIELDFIFEAANSINKFD